jgi:hypothetical protein
MTPETLQAENAELKRKLAEAAENACPCSGGGHMLTKCPHFRAEAAERENLALRAEIGRLQLCLRKSDESHINALDQIVALKARLVEAEKALAVAQRGLKCRQEAEAQAHRTYHDAMGKLPVEAKYLHDPAAQPADMMERMVARAEAAERERDEAEARCKEEKGRRQAAEADLRKTEEHRLAAVAESARYERKCAELSEALRALDSAMLLHTCDEAVRKINNEPNWYDLHKQATAALASQPAPKEIK